MDSITDPQPVPPQASATLDEGKADETSLVSEAASSEIASPEDAALTSAPELKVVAEADPISKTEDDEAFDTGDNMVAPPDFDADQPEAGEEWVAAEAEVPVEIHPHRVVEAILFAADSPMPPAKIAAVLGVGDARDVRKHIERLNEEYGASGLAFRIEQIAGGYQMLTLPAYNPWLRKLLRARQETRLSPAALETLAIVAYKQPCTRAEVEAIRGVAAGDLINRLREMNLVKIVGRAEDLGRPLLYGTTKRFLETFGLPSLDDLPQVEALSGGANGTVRESAKMPAAALANDGMEEQRVAEKMRDARQTPDVLPADAPPSAEELSAPVAVMSAGDPASDDTDQPT